MAHILPRGLKQKWLDALMSGEYRQGKGCLRDQDDNFCCLGVLCDVSGAGVWERQPVMNAANIYRYQIGDSWHAGRLPSALAVDRATENMLIRMNDAGVPFTEIAKVIEEYL